MEVAVRVEGLTKSFGDARALDGVSFAIEGPQIVGILGPNGAGKTTLLAILEGLLSADRGAVSLFGQPLVAACYPRRRVGVVLQRESALDGITTGEYAELFAAIYEVAGGRESILNEAALGGRETCPVDALSGGEAQRLFLAAATVHQPELVFLDEPTAQLDPENKLRIGRWMRDLASWCTVVLTTHDLREADAICDRVLFLVGGRLMAQGTPTELLASVPVEKRSGHRMEDAFFHHCACQIAQTGELR
ncbi:MAG: ABC transporter ATP-binding protein [Candidatus Wallbacteria bacterium]|nr:ABC transporter ATP-binding protein [Candidatus Wallbacteria bacterium]